MGEEGHLATGGAFTPRVRRVLGLTLLVALAIDFLLYTGFYASDDIGYLAGAEIVGAGAEPAEPSNVSRDLSIARLGMTIPTGVAYWLTGGDVSAIAWLYVLYHLALVVLAFALGRLIHGEVAGLAAAGLAATCPVFTVFAGAILPDNATALWLGLLLLVLELIRRRAAAGPLPWRRALAWFGAAGFVIGLAYSVKETGVIMVIPAAVCVMAMAPRLRDPVWIRNGAFMAAGLCAFMLLELLLIRAITGDWIIRLGMMDDAGDAMANRMEYQGGASPFGRLWYALGDRLAGVAPVTIWLLLVGSMAYGFLPGRSLGLLLFFWWPFLYLTIGSTNPLAYQPPSIQVRYYAIVIIPAVIMTAAVLVALVRRWREWPRPPTWTRGRAAGAAVVVLLALCVGYELADNARGAGNIYHAERARGFEATYERARAEYPQYPIVLGPYYARRMQPLYRNYDPGDIHTGPTDPVPPYLLLEYKKKIDGRLLPEGTDARTLEIVYPPFSRWEMLTESLRRMVGAHVESGRRNLRSGGVIQLVTRRGAVLLTAPPRLPLVVFGGEARVAETDPGHLLTWTGKPDFLVQYPERGGTGQAPKASGVQLPPETHRVRIAVDARLVRGRNARIRATGFGYDATGAESARAQAVAAVEARGSPATLALELSSPRPITSFRLRLSVKSGSAWAAALHLGEPRIETESAAAP